MDKMLAQSLSDENAASSRLMKCRVHKILLVCCSYDGYILEEDGHIEQQINREYIELNMSNPPSFTRVSSTREALDILRVDDSFDFILTMYNVGEPDVFAFAREAKQLRPKLLITLLTSFSKDIYRRIEEQDRSGIDYIFSWHGNTELITAIIKLAEDRMNAADDILQGGVQAILLVEDSIRFYSTYLPELYKLILLQNTEFLKDALNEQQQVLRKRARPKILLATNYEDAVNIYNRYKRNLLGVISDMGFVLHKYDAPSQEKPDAGIDLCRMIRADNPLMPILLQSSQVEVAAPRAAELGVGFLAKNSKTLLQQLHQYISREFAFGDFRFKDPATGAVVGKAKDLHEMEVLIATVSDAVFEYHTSQNHLSKWLYSRGLFPLAASIRDYNQGQFASVAEHRAAIVTLVRDYRTLLGQGVVARFDPETYSDVVGFARIGEGSIGGKARGLAFMNSMLVRHHLYDKFESVRVLIPRSVVITTDFFDCFMQLNGLEKLVDQELTDEEVLSEFVSSAIPPELYELLRAYVRTVSSPLAIRSSSKLEDSHYQPFAGIYSTYMIPHVEDEDQMLRLLVRAVKSVYASIYFAASKSYIQSSQNLISEEKMAVVIQEVCGTEQDGYFFPTFSGVARSINYYPIGDEKPEDGICSVAMGLGKLVVDGGKTLRFSPAYPQRVLQTSTPHQALTDTQTEVLALDLCPEAFRTSIDDAVNLRHFDLSQIGVFRNAEHVCSVWDRENGRISEASSDQYGKIITFNKILKYDTFPLARIVTDLLAMGQEEMRCPVEIEFAVNMDVLPGQQRVFNLLQIRPIIDNQDNRPVDWSRENPSEAFVYSEHALGVGAIEGVHDLIYVKPGAFDRMQTERIAEELLALNARMRDEKRGYVLVGPGRWGSSIPTLGVPVKWTHISEAKVIVECNLPDFELEPSQGTHFFQNVTSLGVGYFTISPFRDDGVFRVEELDALPATEEGQFLRRVSFDEALYVCADGRSGRGIVRKA